MMRTSRQKCRPATCVSIVSENGCLWQASHGNLPSFRDWENIIYCWKSKQRQLSSQRNTAGQVADVWQEVDQLREKLRQTELERDILDPMLTHVCWSKKALAIFSRMT